MMAIELEAMISSIIPLAKQAGKAILDIYQSAENSLLKIKEDGSPLTKADQAANTIIVDGLKQLLPLFPILSEEETDIPFTERGEWERYWLIDPLDGTKEFLEKTQEFTVNIALVENHHAVLGVVYAPVLDECYFAYHQGGAFKQIGEAEAQPIRVKPWQDDTLKVMASRRHGLNSLQSFLEKLENYELTYSGSSLKFCRIAEGAADIYPRLATTSEWDTAAAQCIVEQAGGVVMDIHGLPLQYNTRDSLQNPHFLVVGDSQHDWLRYLKSI